MASLVVVSQSFTIERDVEFEIVRPEWHWVIGLRVVSWGKWVIGLRVVSFMVGRWW